MIKENPKTTILIAYITAILGQVCGLAFTILIFRQLSVEDVGSYALIMATAAFAGFAMDMGINQTLVRGFSQNQFSFRQALLGSMVIRMPVMVIGFIAFFIWFHFTASLSSKELAPLLLAIFWQFLTGLHAIPTSWLRARDRQNTANTINSLLPVSRLLIGLILVYYNLFNLLFFFLGMVLAEMMGTALAFGATQKMRLPLNLCQSLAPAQIKNAVADMWKPSLVFSGVGLCTLLQNRLDWMLVYAFVSKTDLAYYSLANKIYEVFNAFIGVIINTAFPWMCKIMAAGEENYKLIVGLKGFAFLGILLAGLTALLLPHFLTIFLGSKYASADQLIFWLMVGACLTPVIMVIYYLLVSLAMERYLLIITGVATAAQVTADLILIPRFGGLGAAMGMIALLLTTFCLYYYFVRHTTIGISLPLRKINTLVALLILLTIIIKYYIISPTLRTFIYIVISSLLGFNLIFSKNERAFVYSYGKKMLLQWKIL